MGIGSYKKEYSLADPGSSENNIDSTEPLKTAAVQDVSPDIELEVSNRGKVFWVSIGKLMKHPNSTLAKDVQKLILEGDNNNLIKVKYNRNHAIFKSILDLYETGTLHIPQNVCWYQFTEEMQFWNLDSNLLSSCCLDRFTDERDKEEAVQMIHDYWSYECADDDKKGCFSALWKFLEHPHSSTGAMVWSYVSTLVMILALVVLCVDTVPEFRVVQEYNGTRNHTERYLSYSATYIAYRYSRPEWVLIYLDFIVTAILTLEFVLRFISCPRRCLFLTKWENPVAFLSLLPSLALAVMYFIMPSLDTGNAFPVINFLKEYIIPFRILRVVYLLRYGQYYPVLRVIILTVKASVNAILLVCSLLAALGVLYGGALFYMEMHMDTLSSIPDGIWWGIVTMTTVGYGDKYPLTPQGQFLGVVTAITGIVVITLPIAVVGVNFSRFDEAMQVIKKEEKTLYKKKKSVKA